MKWTRFSPTDSEIRSNNSVAQFSKKHAKCVLTLMSNHEDDFWWWIHILQFKYVWNSPTLSLAWFFFFCIEFRTIWKVMKIHSFVNLALIYKRRVHISCSLLTFKDYLIFYSWIYCLFTFEVFNICHSSYAWEIKEC